MDEKTSIKLLSRHGIKPTSNRILVVKALAAEEYPSTLTELENLLLSVDKSGIFRALTLFREHHLVHTIEDGNGGIRYELCMSHSDDDDEDEDLHVHFFCERCHRIYCLHDTPVPTIDLPAGFTRQSCNYVVKGICEECNRRDGLIR
jgi:Fur family transcriptional regulator, ferric uptake regulator